jgi:anhydro-N-acetylmuramic acid kinase
MLRRGDRSGRVILNLGGIANLTFLPRDGDVRRVVAFDTGPGNMVVDALFRALFPGQGDFDDGGVRAAAGSPSDEVCAEMMAHPFFASTPPRSAGHREFGPHFAWTLKRVAEARGLVREDVLATAARLTVTAVVDAMRRFVPEGAVDEVFVTGGGARNRAMMDGLGAGLDGVPVRPIDDLGVPAEAKEGVDFAFLAREALFGRPNVIRSVTGAARELILGTIARG